MNIYYYFFAFIISSALMHGMMQQKVNGAPHIIISNKRDETPKTILSMYASVYVNYLHMLPIYMPNSTDKWSCSVYTNCNLPIPQAFVSNSFAYSIKKIIPPTIPAPIIIPNQNTVSPLFFENDFWQNNDFFDLESLTYNNNDNLEYILEQGIQ